jgi:hypothetical protein
MFLSVVTNRSKPAPSAKLSSCPFEILSHPTYSCLDDLVISQRRSEASRYALIKQDAHQTHELGRQAPAARRGYERQIQEPLESAPV